MEPEAPLEASLELVFDTALPAGLERTEDREEVVHFRTRHTLSSLIRFYRRELPQHAYRRLGGGARFTGSESEIYVIDHASGYREVVYIDARIQERFEAAFSEPPAAAPNLADLPFVQRYPWPAGAVVPNDMLQALHNRDPAVRWNQSGSLIPTTVDPAQPASPRLGQEPLLQRRPGERSLRPPARTEDGQPLPSYGTQPAVID